MNILADQLACFATPVVLQSPPTRPFQSIELSDFDFVSAHTPRPFVVSPSYGSYNDLCLAHPDCYFRRVDRSPFCDGHNIMAEEVLRQSHPTPAMQQHLTSLLQQHQTVSVRCKVDARHLGTLALSSVDDLNSVFTEKSKKLRKTLQSATPEYIRNIFTDGRILRVLDTEFATIAYAQSTAFSMSIRDIAGNFVLSTSVDYNGTTVLQLEKELTKFNQRNRELAYSYIRRHYPPSTNSPTTSSMSLSAVGRKLRELGLPHTTHRIINWISPVDRMIVFRALLGHDQIVDKTPPEVI